MTYQVLARRWRPTTFEAVVGQGPIVRTLQNALGRDRIAHAYLFAGPRGCGKTTTARLLAMGLNCEQPRDRGPVPCASCPACREVMEGRALDVIEIDGASNRGIEDVRALRENARYAPARGRRKVYIVDEVHMLTEPAFNALLKTLEEPPAHVVFVLATTEARKLPPTILSRCQRFDFRPIPIDELTAALAHLLEAEGRLAPAAAPPAAEPDALRLIARAADGSLRDALSLLDTALAYGEGRVTTADVQALTGSGGAEAAWALAEALVARRAPEALRLVGDTAAAGLDLGALAQEAMEVLRQALVVRVTGRGGLELTAEEATRLGRLGAEGARGEAELMLLVKALLDAETEMRRSPHPRVDLEVAIVRLCHRPDPQAIESVLARLEAAESRLRGYGGSGSLGADAVAPVQVDLLGGPPPPVPAGAGSSLPVRAPEASRGPAGRGPAGAGEATERSRARNLGGGESEPASPGASLPGEPSGARPFSPSPPSVPPAPSAPSSVAGSTGPPPREAVDATATWGRIVAEITRQRPSLGQILEGAVVVSEEAGRLTVAVPNGNAFTREQLKLPANRELLIQAARRAQPGIRDVTLTTELPAGVPVAAVPEHPRVKAALTLFDGEIAAIRPAGSGVRSPGPEEEA